MNPAHSKWMKPSGGPILQHIYDSFLGGPPFGLKGSIPRHPPGGKVPYMPAWNLHLASFLFNGTQLAIPHIYTLYTGSSLGGLAIYLYNSIFTLLSFTLVLPLIDWFGLRYGYLDGHQHERDTAQDRKFQSAPFSLVTLSFLRPIMPLLLTSRIDQLPLSPTLVWLPIKMGIYTIVLDFWFYWHHRISHELRIMRRLHRTHHLSTHPSAAIYVLFDVPDELITFVIVPLLTLETLRIIALPLSFYEWSVCSLAVIGVELFGHSGLRIYATAFTLGIFTWLLRYWDAELCIEDHDLHHRLGFAKRSGNYGKQTRLWDRVFGTCLPRVECTSGNIDFESPICLFSDIWRLVREVCKGKGI